MESKEFVTYRKKINRTQKELAILLGVSLKAISSYEQGWRTIPCHIERQLLYLVSNARRSAPPLKDCWTILNCPKEKKENCPAWEFQSGKNCWMISGTICHGKPQASWDDKIALCKKCKVLQQMLKD